MAKKVKVKILNSFSTANGTYAIDEVVEEDSTLTNDWVKHGLAAEEATTTVKKIK
jgi:hypothetical protein